MRRYVRKPVEVEALCWDPTDAVGAVELAQCLLAAGVAFNVTMARVVEIPGFGRLYPGSYLVRGGEVAFEVVSADDFEAEYELAPDPEVEA